MFSNDDVFKAHSRIKQAVIKTPCVFSPHISELIGAEVFLKLENMQRTGSFKERGALNFLLCAVGPLAHVVTASAGNHAQAVAMHAARLGIEATIFMPMGTSNSKVLATERFGAQVRLVGQNYDEAYAQAWQFSRKRKVQYLHAYNDIDVIQGQATIAIEIFEQIGIPDVIFVPVGGGGLISGIAQFAASACGSSCPKIIGVEAEQFQSLAQALKKGQGSLGCLKDKTIAEGIAVSRAGDLAIELCRKHKPELVSVGDREIQKAMMLLFEKQKIVTEGAAAASLAASLDSRYRKILRNKRVVLVISGGNIDISLLSRLIAQELVGSNRLCRMSLVIRDSPGSLSNLLQTITRSYGNIVDIRHERAFSDLRWNEVLVDVVVEVKDSTHEKLMHMGLKDEGYAIRDHRLELACGR